MKDFHELGLITYDKDKRIIPVKELIYGMFMEMALKDLGLTKLLQRSKEIIEEKELKKDHKNSGKRLYNFTDESLKTLYEPIEKGLKSPQEIVYVFLYNNAENIIETMLSITEGDKVPDFDKMKDSVALFLVLAQEMKPFPKPKGTLKIFLSSGTLSEYSQDYERYYKNKAELESFSLKKGLYATLGQLIRSYWNTGHKQSFRSIDKRFAAGEKRTVKEKCYHKLHNHRVTPTENMIKDELRQHLIEMAISMKKTVNSHLNDVTETMRKPFPEMLRINNSDAFVKTLLDVSKYED